jgi:hypothetical protein
MNQGKIPGHRTALLMASLLVGTGLLGAADDAATITISAVQANSAATATEPQANEIDRLKAAMADQQKQLQMLQQMLAKQQALLEKALGAAAVSAEPKPTSFNGIGQVASTSPMIPVAPIPAVAFPVASPRPQAAPAAASKNPCEAAPDDKAIPPYLRLGSVCIIPVGFMDLTPFWRDKNAGSSMGSNFGSVP